MVYLGSRKNHYVALEVVEGSALASSLLLRDRVKAVLLRRVSDRLSFDLHAEGESLCSDAPSLDLLTGVNVLFRCSVKNASSFALFAY